LIDCGDGVKQHGGEKTSVIALVRQLVADGRVWAKAELAYYRALAGERMADAKLAAIFGIAALVIANAALIALLVGGILILLPLVGAFWATVLVIVFALAVAAALGLSALDHAKRAARSPGGETR